MSKDSIPAPTGNTDSTGLPDDYDNEAVVQHLLTNGVTGDTELGWFGYGELPEFRAWKVEGLLREAVFEKKGVARREAKTQRPCDWTAPYLGRAHHKLNRCHKSLDKHFHDLRNIVTEVAPASVLDYDPANDPELHFNDPEFSPEYDYEDGPPDYQLLAFRPEAARQQSAQRLRWPQWPHMKQEAATFFESAKRVERYAKQLARLTKELVQIVTAEGRKRTPGRRRHLALRDVIAELRLRCDEANVAPNLQRRRIAALLGIAGLLGGRVELPSTHMLRLECPTLGDAVEARVKDRIEDWVDTVKKLEIRPGITTAGIKSRTPRKT